MLKHSPRRIVAFSLLAISLEMAFIPPLFAQRVAQRQQDAPLKTLTLSGKGGTPRSATPQAGSRPRPLTRTQKLALFKGKTPIKSFTLTSARPVIPDKAGLDFMLSQDVISYVFPEGQSRADFKGADDTVSEYWYMTPHPYLSLWFRAKAGQLYAIDFSVSSNSQDDGTFTIYNPKSRVTQIMPAEGSEQHITAYVTAEQDDWLYYYLSCSKSWTFYSVEVTEL